MHVALVTDTHFGARGDSVAFDNYFKLFYDNIFFPELEKRNIKHIVHLGDAFDRRKYINFNSLQTCKEYFFDAARDRQIKVDMIVGNHDTFYKNTNDVNSPELLLREYDNVTTYSKATTITIDGKHILLLPWICTDNYEYSLEQIKRTKAKICFGHLELAGFVMFKTQDSKDQTSHDGFDPNYFKEFDLVCSGHFHHRHGKGNIKYLGNPYEMFWNDYDDPRGFHIFDTSNNNLEFVVNPYTIFEKIYYDDEKQLPDVNQFASKHVKVVVVNKTNVDKYDYFLDTLYKVNPIEVKIVEDFSEFESDVLDEEAIDLSDTQTLLLQYIDSLETDVDKNKLKTLMKTLYVEAQDYE